VTADYCFLEYDAVESTDDLEEYAAFIFKVEVP
jgi:hypothetical protein